MSLSPAPGLVFKTSFKLATGKIHATTILCSPALIRAITPRLGRVLGPKGLMPSERRGTVTEDFSGFIRNLIGTSEWKADKRGAIRVPFAKVCCMAYTFEPCSDDLFSLIGHKRTLLGTSRKLCNRSSRLQVTPRPRILREVMVCDKPRLSFTH